MKNIFGLFLIVVVTMAVLGACSRKERNDAQTSEVDTAHEFSLPPAADMFQADDDFAAAEETAAMPPQSEEEQAPVITVGKAPEDIAGEYHFFADDQTSERIIFHTTESVENFAYIEILPSIDDEDNFVLLAGDVLFGLDDFTPEKPFVVTVNIGSGIPARGILFWYRGMVRYFYITESGMDGSTLLVEFNPSPSR